MRNELPAICFSELSTPDEAVLREIIVRKL